MIDPFFIDWKNHLNKTLCCTFEALYSISLIYFLNCPGMIFFFYLFEYLYSRYYPPFFISKMVLSVLFYCSHKQFYKRR